MDPTKPPIQGSPPSVALPFAIGLLLLFATTLAALPALAGEWVRDDVLYVIANAPVTSPTPAAEYWTRPFQPESDLGLWRPITTLSLRLDFLLSHHWFGHGLDSRIFHVTNVLWTTVAGLLLAALLRRLGAQPVAAAVAGALYCVLAGKSEALLWVSGRAEVLMTAFALLALVAASGRSLASAGLATVAAGLAAASKEQGFLVPLLILAWPRPWKHRLLMGLGPGLLLVGLFALRSMALGGALGPGGANQVLADATLLERAKAALGWFGDAIRLLVFPHPLLNEYDEPSRSALAAWPWLGVAFGFGLVYLAIRHPRARFGLAILVTPLIPVLNLLYRTGEPFAERFLALPAAGFVLVLSRFLRQNSARWPVWLLLVLALGHGWRTHHRAYDFRTEDNLARAQLLDAPNSAGGQVLFGKALLMSAEDMESTDDFGRRERRAAARVAFETAHQLRPDSALFALNLAQFCMEEARPRDPQGSFDWALLKVAEDAAENAAIADARLAEPWLLRAQIALARGQKPVALGQLDRAIANDSRALGAHLFRISLLDSATPASAQARQAFLQVVERLRETRPYDGKLALLLAQARLWNGDQPGARAAAASATAVARAPHQIAETALKRADLERATGRESEARAILQAAHDRLVELRGAAVVRFDLELALSAVLRARGDLDGSRAAYVQAREWATTPDQHRRLRTITPP